MPVVACTAWQMVFEHGQADATKRVLIHGAAGNVGAYAVQFAKRAAKEVVATAFSADIDYVRALGADRVIDVQASRVRRTADRRRHRHRYRWRRYVGSLVPRSSAGRRPRVIGRHTRRRRGRTPRRPRGVLPGRRLVWPARRDRTSDRCWPAPNQRRRRPAARATRGLLTRCWPANLTSAARSSCRGRRWPGRSHGAIDYESGYRRMGRR